MSCSCNEAAAGAGLVSAAAGIWMIATVAPTAIAIATAVITIATYALITAIAAATLGLSVLTAQAIKRERPRNRVTYKEPETQEPGIGERPAEIGPGVILLGPGDPVGDQPVTISTVGVTR